MGQFGCRRSGIRCIPLTIPLVRNATRDARRSDGRRAGTSVIQAIRSSSEVRYRGLHRRLFSLSMTASDAERRRFEQALAWLGTFTDWEQRLPPERTPRAFDLSRMERLVAALGSPHLGRPCLHVTGTKGKGSVVFLADAILRAHGLRTFRFVSPHVESVHERMAFGGRDVDDATFADLAAEVRSVIDGLAEKDAADLPTWFETTAAMGFT